MMTTYDALLLAWQTITHRLNYTDTLDPVHAAWVTQAREALAAIDEALLIAGRETTQSERNLMLEAIQSWAATHQAMNCAECETLCEIAEQYTHKAPSK